MTAEDEDGGQQAADHSRAAEHMQQRAQAAAVFRTHSRQYPQLPKQRQAAGDRTEDKDVTPANQAAKIAAERCGDHRGNRHAGEDDRQRFWYIGGGHQAHGSGRGHRPESAYRYTQQQTASQQYLQRRGKCHQQARDNLHD